MQNKGRSGRGREGGTTYLADDALGLGGKEDDDGEEEGGQGQGADAGSERGVVPLLALSLGQDGPGGRGKRREMKVGVRRRGKKGGKQGRKK